MFDMPYPLSTYMRSLLKALGTSLAAMVPTALVGTYTHHTHGTREQKRCWATEEVPCC